MSGSLKFLLFVTVLVILAAAAVIAPGMIALKVAFQPPEPTAGSGERITFVKVGEAKIAMRWYPPVSARSPVILYSHGNAEDLGMTASRMKQFHESGFGVLAYDYEGYGASGGKPSPEALLRDADAAWEYLTGKLNIEPSRIILMGFSIGSAPTCHLAARHTPRAVVLKAPIASAFQVVLPVMEKWPGNFFMNVHLARRFSSPLLVVHGEKDFISRIGNGRLIADAAPGNKKFVPVPGAGHNDLLSVLGSEGFLKEVAEVAELSKMPGSNKYVLGKMQSAIPGDLGIRLD